MLGLVLDQMVEDVLRRDVVFREAAQAAKLLQGDRTKFPEKDDTRRIEKAQVLVQADAWNRSQPGA